MGRRERVLVTGGAGLIGSRLVHSLLREGRRVKVLDVRYGELSDDKANRNLELIGIGGTDLHGGNARW